MARILPSPARASAWEAFTVTLVLVVPMTYAALSGPPRGANTWDSLAGTVDEKGVIAAIDYVAKVLLPFGYDTVTIDGGWYDHVNGTPSLDEFGLPYPSIEKFPSAADGRGLRSIVEHAHSLGVKLGAWTIRGVPRAAVASGARINGSDFTVADAASYERNCSWDNMVWGTNAPSAAATAWYESVARLYVNTGLDFVKIDCMW